MVQSKVGRNDPCPCGSGKKYKHCCLFALGARAGYTQEERQSARSRMEAFISGDEWLPVIDTAVRAYWGPFVDEIAQLSEEMLEQSASTYDPWFWFDFRLSDGHRIVDRFLEQTHDLTPGERAYLQQLRGTTVRLYEVESVVPGASLTLRDLLTGQTSTVRDRLGSRSMRRWDVVAARVVPAGASGQPEIDDVIPPVPRIGTSELVEKLKGELLVWSQEHPGADELLFFETLAPRFYQRWLETVVARGIPRIMMADGEEALITRVHFGVDDREALVVALDRARDMHREGEESVWEWRPRRSEHKEPPTSVRLRGDALILEALTKGAAERGRARIERIAGAAVRAGLTTHQDIGQAIADLGDDFESSLVDTPETDEVALEYHQRHYHSWLAEALPALDGHTPREAARSKTLQPRLVDLIKGLEQLYCRSLDVGQLGFDPSWMWDELGLSDVPGAPPANDHPPPLGHESMTRLVPGLADVARSVAERIRRGADDPIETVVTEEELHDDLSVRRFLKAYAEQALHDGLQPDGAVADANLLGVHLE